MSDELFAAARNPGSGAAAAGPLADRMRPRVLDEFIGQDHIVGPGRLLRRAIQRDRLSSIILSGPPGTGKTTLARVIANTTSSRFLSINAVLSGVQAIRDAIESASRDRDLYDRRTILFVDEVHRWNKAQQDALLPSVENGTIILIGATTENPYFEVNRALVSRSRVFQLRSLTDDDLAGVARSAIDERERGYGRWKIGFEDGALEHLVSTADGDARSLLNALELAIETSVDPWPPADGYEVTVSMAAAEESIQKRAVLYDRDGDCHYDAASAFIKSIRGSDPDASLYWLARMVYAGEEPRFIFRRMLISACEDIGLADPQATGVVAACAAAYDRIGLPEGQFHLTQAALYLATAPKSNSALAYFDALKAVETEGAEVPNHLKDASRDAEGLGHGAGYLYPHAYRGHWTAQQYLPDTLKGTVFYRPGTLGYEAGIRDAVSRKRETQLAAWLSGFGDDPEPASDGSSSRGSIGRGSAAWNARASGSGAIMAQLRTAIFEAAQQQRHENVLVLNADDGLLLPEAVRTGTDGSACGLCKDEEALKRLTYLFSDTEELLKPSLAVCIDPAGVADSAIDAAGHGNFDLVLAVGFVGGRKGGAAAAALRGLKDCAGRFEGARFVLAERLPAGAGILPALLKSKLASSSLLSSSSSVPSGLADRFAELDALFFESGEAGMNTEALLEALEDAGLKASRHNVLRSEAQRILGDKEAETWMGSSSTYGKAVHAAVGELEAGMILSTLKEAFAAGPVSWPSAWAIVSVCTPDKGSE
ncbi:MAG: AAA family ATPase [Spirochaetia bacterium]|nr:AAA family ATPase [Spirochaetia bacterium]